MCPYGHHQHALKGHTSLKYKGPGVAVARVWHVEYVRKTILVVSTLVAA